MFEQKMEQDLLNHLYHPKHRMKQIKLFRFTISFLSRLLSIIFSTPIFIFSSAILLVNVCISMHFSPWKRNVYEYASWF